jgi:hypothetical protein
LYKLQIINAQTQEIIREKIFRKPDHILSLLESAKKGQVCFLFDEDCRTYTGDYVSHSIFTEDDLEVYRMVFKLKLSEIQARVSKHV